MKIMHRQVQQIRGEQMWGRMLDLERRSDAFDAAHGNPVPARYRVFAAGMLNTQTRIEERTYDSVVDWATRFEARQDDDTAAEMEVERRQIFEFERDEMYYVDEFRGAPPRWAQVLDATVTARRDAAATRLQSILAAGGDAVPLPEPYSYTAPASTEEVVLQPFIRTAKPLAIMYRQVQEIKEGMWEGQFELERKTDEVEGAEGHPLPKRYRAFSGGPLNSQLRVHQRTYPSIGEWGKLVEDWSRHEEMQVIEVERKQFYNWEREEILYVDLPGVDMIRWIGLMVESERAKAATERFQLDTMLENLHS